MCWNNGILVAHPQTKESFVAGTNSAKDSSATLTKAVTFTHLSILSFKGCRDYNTKMNKH